jgi:hypothetical protein
MMSPPTFEVDVDAAARCGGELGGPVVGLIVDGRVKAELVGQQRTLLGAAAIPTTRASSAFAS